MNPPSENLWQTPGPWFGLATGLAAPTIALAHAGIIPLGWAIGLAIGQVILRKKETTQEGDS